MHADLCRKLALILQSPAYKQYQQRRPDPDAVSQQFIDACLKANTEDQLPDSLQQFFAGCEESIALADKKSYQSPYTQAQIEEITEELA